MTAPPACSYEREASPAYECAKTHCSTCGAHRVWTGPEEWVYRCEMDTQDDQNEEPERPESTLEAFA